MTENQKVEDLTKDMQPPALKSVTLQFENSKDKPKMTRGLVIDIQQLDDDRDTHTLHALNLTTHDLESIKLAVDEMVEANREMIEKHKNQSNQ